MSKTLTRAEVRGRAETLRHMITTIDNPSEKQMRRVADLAFELAADALVKLTILAEDVQARHAQAERQAAADAEVSKTKPLP